MTYLEKIRADFSKTGFLAINIIHWIGIFLYIIGATLVFNGLIPRGTVGIGYLFIFQIVFYFIFLIIYFATRVFSDNAKNVFIGFIAIGLLIQLFIFFLTTIDLFSFM